MTGRTTGLKAAAAIGVLAVALAACGGDGGTAREGNSVTQSHVCSLRFKNGTCCLGKQEQRRGGHG